MLECLEDRWLPSLSVAELPTLLTNNSSPQSITAGPDGNLWFTENNADKIGRITTSGTLNEFNLGADTVPMRITSGPDGNLWFTEFISGKIGRISPSGSISEFPTKTSGSGPFGIAVGPDHNLWFTEQSGQNIGRITPSGSVTEFPVPTTQPNATSAIVSAITAGPDGNLWFGEAEFDSSILMNVGADIGRITPSGTITLFPLLSMAGPSSITAGPDGNLWFTLGDIWRITPSGSTTEFSLPNANSEGITAGPDGNLWFTESLANKIGRITPSGTITEFSSGLSSGSGPFGITAGPDGNLWLTESAGNRIARTSTQPSAILRVVAPSFPTDAYHFHTLQDALANAIGGHDTIIIEPGARAGAFPNTNLATTANMGDTTIITNAAIPSADVILIGTQTDLVVAVAPAAGGFYALTLHDPLASAQPAGTAVSSSPNFALGGTIGIDNSVTIMGDPNAPPAPGGIGTNFEVWSGTLGATFKNLNISSLTLDSNSAQTQVLGSNVGSLNEAGGLSGNGQNLFEGDTGIGLWNLTGNMNPGLLTSDQILNNHFTNGARVLLGANDDGDLVEGNFFDGQPNGSSALEVDDSQHVIVSRNTFALTGGSNSGSFDEPIAIDYESVSRATSVTILNNVIDTGGLGTGLNLNLASGKNFEALVQGNDFHDNAIGVLIFGGNADSGTSSLDLGGGSAGDLGASLGGNNFRSFTASSTANGHFAVYMQDTVSTDVVSAHNNIWSVADPNSVVKDGTHNTNLADINNFPGTGMVDVGMTQLAANQQFVQTLYNDFLKRSGSLAELNFWVSQLPSLGQNGVANDIIRSDEAYRRLVDTFYLQYLGRPADPGGETSWAKALEHGSTEEQVIAGFLGSPEYYDHATALASALSPDANFVQSLYEQLLGRVGSASEIQGWVNQLPTLGRSGVALNILNSSEALTDRVLQFYVHLLHRPGRPSAAELNSWVASKLDTLSIEVLISGSQEFFGNG
jgi:streptogramin lyase